MKINPIPNHFHFVFGLKRQWESFHILYYLCLESCWQVNQPDKIYFHYHHLPHGKYWDKIKDRLTLIKVDPIDFVSEFKYEDKAIRPFRYAHHSDFIRLQALLEYGGVYADMDTLFINKAPENLYRNDCVMGRENDIICQKTNVQKASLCNAYIMAKPNSDFIRTWLEKLPAAFDGTWSNHSCTLPHELSQEHPEWIHVESERAFFSIMWTIEDLQKLFESCESDWDKAYSIHLWSHLWWKKSRRDFSPTHAGMFNEKYIKTVDTTFNLVARRFL